MSTLPLPAPNGSAGSIGAFQAHGDVGSPTVAGSTAYDTTNQAYTVVGGANRRRDRDAFQFAWQKLSGDFILRARAEFVGQGEPHGRFGWQVRASLDADSPCVDVGRQGDGLVSLQYRTRPGGITRALVLAVSHADVLQLERRGDTFIAAAARYGEPFVTRELGGVDLGDDVHAGLFVCAQRPDATDQAVFRDVRIIGPAPAWFVPYTDYLGSTLEVLELASGRHEVLHRSTEPFEAPNWTRDGSALIYNVSGSGPNKGVLMRFDLATRRPAPIDTSSCTQNNNDHVLSFDGRMLGISNQGPDSQGESAVFVLPAAGGVPRRVTLLTPSYLHGWSPDGKWLVYTGGRREPSDGRQVFSLYKVAVEGGDEIRLTHGPGLDDGPEFSPDGRYIYFNSTRSGRMQIWRMKPDGTDVEQVTNDIYNNWFPHLSPDGKWIAFLSYLPDVAPDQHPYYRQVYLRVMPVEHGGARIVAYVYGGQGTMNVPSWSPDSQRIAFVSNSAR